MKDGESLKPPSALLLALEGRAPWEFGAALASFPLMRLAPRGDGHPVVVFPGLAASDLSTLPLRAFLRERGYRPHGWDLRFNFGPRAGVLAQSLERVRRIRAQTGRKVSLVGWSLGGVYAREIAKLLSDDVRCVITLGTPFTGDPKANNAWRIYEFASGHSLDDREQIERVREAPTTWARAIPIASRNAEVSRAMSSMRYGAFTGRRSRYLTVSRPMRGMPR